MGGWSVRFARCSARCLLFSMWRLWCATEGNRKKNFEVLTFDTFFLRIFAIVKVTEAIEHFATKIKGFNDDNIVVAACESRTSSPVRIERDENFESNIKGIYPCGEGAGYAGGITTSAMDGIKVAEAIMTKYKSLK